ncbi:unnamed protein product [Protopolystoma xenopodis]|uniref:Uncharacterized protein n=1 Tax=Protopolystoma xenopodis TaxID=117903 RepID=A0A448X2J5_9PLAT|nr:unnamed protein product [Protopolystoma xenopodis]
MNKPNIFTNFDRSTSASGSEISLFNTPTICNFADMPRHLPWHLRSAKRHQPVVMATGRPIAYIHQKQQELAHLLREVVPHVPETRELHIKGLSYEKPNREFPLCTDDGLTG